MVEELIAREHDRLQATCVSDPATGLLHGGQVMGALDLALSRLAPAGVSLSLVACDIDHFKLVNDEHGHPVGDETLAAIAESFRRQARRHDVVTRYGGDWFLVVLMDTGPNTARAWAELARTALREARLGPLSSVVTASFGVATNRPDESADALFERADRALYTAKKLGRDRVEIDAGT